MGLFAVGYHSPTARGNLIKKKYLAWSLFALNVFRVPRTISSLVSLYCGNKKLRSFLETHLSQNAKILVWGRGLLTVTSQYVVRFSSSTLPANCVESSYPMTRSGADVDRRTPLKPGAQLDLASPYAVPRTRRTESPTSLNYAKLCVELNYTGAAIGEMWGDLVIRHIVLE